MQIDWLTVAAQIVNFLVLVWLLQRFLYRPITQAMRRREERIAERLAEAKAVRTQAEVEAEELRGKERALDAAREEILDAARADADALRARLEAELREEMEDKRETWHLHLQEERDDFARTLQRRAGHQLLDIAASVLADFADAELTERIAGTFITRLERLEDDARKRLADAAARAESATVASGYSIDSATRGRITRALHAALSTDIPVEYRTDEDILLGIRLTIGEQSVEWSATRHLKRLGTTLDEILESASHGLPGAELDAESAPAKEERPLA